MERREDFMPTGDVSDGNGAAISWKVAGSFACGIAVQTLEVVRVGRPPILHKFDHVLFCSTSASGLPTLKSVDVMLPKVSKTPACLKGRILHVAGLHPVLA